MKRNLLATLVAALLLVPPVFAQHGRGGMGSMGSGNMGNSGNAGRDNNANPNPNGVGPKTQDQLLSPTSKLASNLDNLLKPYGITSAQACQGFTHLGQCVAAIHVSHNLKNVNFYCLKADMVPNTTIPQGTSCPSGTGTKMMSLGQSIHQLDPQANSKLETKVANKQASQDLKQSRS